MTCPACGGDLAPGHTTEFVILRPLVYLVVEGVPAQICQRCGESYTTTGTTDDVLYLLQRLRESLPAGGRATLSYDYRDVPALPRSA